MRCTTQVTKITFTFLTNLVVSDIAFGSFVVFRSIIFVISPEYTLQLCRMVIGVGVMTSIMSALCILLLSLQVGTMSTAI